MREREREREREGNEILNGRDSVIWQYRRQVFANSGNEFVEDDLCEQFLSSSANIVSMSHVYRSLNIQR